MATIEQDDIIFLVGAEDWQEVVDTYSGKPVWKIQTYLDEMVELEDDDGYELAGRIYSALN